MKSRLILVLGIMILLATASCGSDNQGEERRLPTMVSRDVTPETTISTPRPSQLDPEEDKGTGGATPVPTPSLDPTATPVPEPTPTPKPTSTPMPTATPDPTPTPTPEPGTVLFEADFSEGIDDWSGTTGWFEHEGILLQDGSATGSSLIPPFDFSNLRDYAIEVEARAVGNNIGGSRFGLSIRGGNDGYRMGIIPCHVCAIAGNMHSLIFDERGEGVKAEDISKWRTYRAEADGPIAQFIMDGRVLVEMQDNSRLGAGAGGFWVENSQFEVRAFRIIAI